MSQQYAPEKKGTEIVSELQADFKSPLVAMKIDNRLHDLQNNVGSYTALSFVELDSEEGWKIYRNSVTFLLIAALHRLSEEAEVKVSFTVHQRLFCEILWSSWSQEACELLEREMRAMVAARLLILKESMQKEDAVQLFKELRQIEKANLIDNLPLEIVSIYRCEDFADYLYSPMLGNMGDLGNFALDFCENGLFLRTPNRASDGKVPASIPQPKLQQILSEAKKWAEILHCNYVPDLNRAERTGRMGEVIRISEALQEKSIAEIADHIAQDRENLRVILIAGPSSSGKTSFARRLSVQLRVNGLEPVAISLDDYFLERTKTPRNARGEYDFECLEALDVSLFNEHLVALLAGEEVEQPRYNFVTGQREWGKHTPFSVRGDQPLVIEGIHGLNEKLTASVPRSAKFKIYVSALTQLNIDAHNRIPTTDARLLRRMVRDYQFRGSHALKTLRQWPDVREGEEKNIFPFQEEADVMFNTALIYELGILKKYAKPLLEMIPCDLPEYTKARSLLDFCEFFDDIKEESDIPNNSILREFIGKSVFFKDAHI